MSKSKSTVILEPAQRIEADSFPFAVRFSFEGILDYLTLIRERHPGNGSMTQIFDDLVIRLGQADPLQPPESFKAEFGDLSNILLGALGDDTNPSAFILPFVKKMLYASPQFLALQTGVANHIDEFLHLDLIGIKNFQDLTILQAYSIILVRLYGIPLSIKGSMILSSVDSESGFDRQFNVDMDFRFCRVKQRNASEPLPVLTEEQRGKVLEHMSDPEVLRRILPPELFVFEGFVVLRLIDITREHNMSQLKAALTAVDALTEVDKLSVVQKMVQRVLEKPDLGLMLIAVRGETVFHLNTTTEFCEYRGIKRSIPADFENSVMRAAHDSGLAKVIPDLSSLSTPNSTEAEMIKAGIRSILYIPLVLHNQKVGGLLLKSKKVGYFTPVDVMNLADVISSLAIALTRGMDNFETRVRSVIQERYTSIHPSVDWKFRQVAMDTIMLGDQAHKETGIGFENVWPLYSVSDIRSSSHFRNESIREDLLRQLNLASEAVAIAQQARRLPYLDELSWRLGVQHDNLAHGLSSGDELELLSFLTQEVEPVMTGLKGFSVQTDQAVSAYKSAIHPDHHSVYEKRRDFDESVTRINRTISAYIDRVQPEAQEMFPHYFDKNSTDGVDMNMYIGPSMVPDDSWRPMYLKNLRLWQFIVMCRVARLAWRIRRELPLPLQTTHLIMVQDMPISIMFNQDEKRFAVDGAYNIRYEIMKKRIDKAVIKGSGERLTQPDRIAIVYSQHAERLEYERYIGYLQAKDYLEQEIEHLDLDDLQGITGLKAIRVAVKLGEPGTTSGLATDFYDEEVSIIEMIRRETDVGTAGAISP